MQYIYLIREREFLKNNDPVYKIGKTIQDPMDRMKGYPKGSELVLTIKVENCHAKEKKLIKIFDKKFTKRTDIGNEYYEGNVDVMTEIIKNLGNEGEVFNEYQELQKKAKNYGIKANLSKKQLKSDIELIEEGKGYKINPDHVLKTNNNFFLENKKKVGGGVVGLLIIICFILLIRLNSSQ